MDSLRAMRETHRYDHIPIFVIVFASILIGDFYLEKLPIEGLMC